MSRSVLVRLVAVSLIVATCSIVATAWLTTRSTTDQLRSDLRRSLELDNEIHDSLSEFGGANPSWDGVQRVIDSFSPETDRVITLAAADGTILASSDPDHEPTMSSEIAAAAIVDPVAGSMTTSLSSDVREASAKGGRILPASAYVLDADEEAAREKAIQDAILCSRKYDLSIELVDGAFGPTIEFRESDVSDRAYTDCLPEVLQRPGRRYVAISNAIVADETSCLTRNSIAFKLSVSSQPTEDAGSATAPSPVVAAEPLQFLTVSGDTNDPAVAACADAATRTALTSYVAPAALLYFTTPTISHSWLESAGGARIVLTLIAVLVITLAAAALGARRLLRPIRSLTRAAQRMASGDLRARVRVHGHDEVARLGSAFNAMADVVEQNEQQRKVLVSDIAHELRNPLANVRGYLEAAQDDIVLLDDALVENLLEEAMLLQHLIDDLQDLALADAGRLQIHPEPADVVALTAQVVAAHRAIADTAGVTVALTGVERASSTVDQVRIRQVLGNLLSNAIRHTPPGGSVTISLTAAPSTRSVRIEVVDTGQGIGPGDLPHLFDRFYRADTSRSRETGGSGLGLAIARHLVEAHHGSIEVDSTLGVGSRFTIHLPMEPSSLRSPIGAGTVEITSRGTS